jgi:MFS superfamily sulfate permease-like transporter
VLHGFSFAVATTIIIKQLPLIVGIHAQEKKPIPILIELFERINEWILPSIILGCIVLVLLRVVKHLIKLESTFLILMGGIFLSDQINLSHFHIELIGAVSMTRPVLAFPSLSLETWLQLTELGFGLIVIIVAESWGSIRSLAHHQAASALIEPNRELAALGVANLVSGLFQGMAVGAGFSASTVNKKSGSKTKRAGAIAAVILVFIVMWGEKWIGLLPQTLIAAVIIHTLSHAIRLKGLLALWRINRDQYIALSTIFFVLVFDILHGMLIAVGLSIASAVHTFSKPIVKELGELDDSRDYLDKLNHPYVKTYAHLLILRPEEPLFFANIEGVLIEIQKRLQKSDNIKIIVLSLEESVDLDSTAAQFLVEFDFQLQCQNKILLFARVKDPINALLLTLTDGKCLNRLFWSVDDAVKNAEKLKISNLPSPDE